MSLINLNQSELNTLKEKAEKILEELQMNCDFDYENYHEALDQLTAIDGWTESQSTDGGYAEGHDRYASQEEYVEEMKMYLDDSEAKVFFYKSMMFLIFETDYVDRIQRNILDSEYVDQIGQKYNLCELDHLIKDQDRLTQAFKNYLSTVPKLNPSVWELREILAWFKHCWSNELEKAIRMTLCGEYNTVHYSYLVNDYTKQLTYLERIEEVITLGMLDVYQIVEECCFDFGWSESNLQRKKLLNGELGYMLYNDFGKDVGIDFRMLRAQKAQAEKAELDADAKYHYPIMTLAFKDMDESTMFDIYLELMNYSLVIVDQERLIKLNDKGEFGKMSLIFRARIEEAIELLSPEIKSWVINKAYEKAYLRPSSNDTFRIKVAREQLLDALRSSL